MTSLQKQKGFTAIELVFFLGGIAVIGCLGGFVFIAAHFIHKVW